MTHADFVPVGKNNHVVRVTLAACLPNARESSNDDNHDDHSWIAEAAAADHDGRGDIALTSRQGQDPFRLVARAT
jgi:hypothetical protein